MIIKACKNESLKLFNKKYLLKMIVFTNTVYLPIFRDPDVSLFEKKTEELCFLIITYDGRYLEYLEVECHNWVHLR